MNKLAPIDDIVPAGGVGLRPFIHLRVHSAYSLLEGALPVGKIVAHAVNDSAPAIAVTDTNNLFGALEFAQKAVKEGVQPIIGCQVDLAMGEPNEAQRSHHRRGPDVFPVVLIAANEIGYGNLVGLVSRLYLDTPPGEHVHLPVSALADRSEGIICLTGGERGPIGAALKTDHAALAEQRLETMRALFGDRLYVEVSRTSGYDPAVEAGMIDLAYRLELPLVATNEAFFPSRDDYEAHDALISIAEGAVIAADDRRRLSPDNYLEESGRNGRLVRGYSGSA